MDQALTGLAAWGHLPRRMQTTRHGESLMAKISGSEIGTGEKIVVSTDEVAYVRRAD